MHRGPPVSVDLIDTGVSLCQHVVHVFLCASRAQPGGGTGDRKENKEISSAREEGAEFRVRRHC
jgi:hypothetical protein